MYYNNYYSDDYDIDDYDIVEKRKKAKACTLAILLIVFGVAVIALELMGLLFYTSLTLLICKVAFYVSIAVVLATLILFFKNWYLTPVIIKLLEVALFVALIVVGCITIFGGRLATKSYFVSEQYGVVYAETNTEYNVVKIQNKKDKVHIFTEIDNIRVTKISKNAAKGNDTMLELEFDSGNITIEKGAFSNCARLKRITLGSNCDYTIRKNAFSGCTNLQDFNIGSANVTVDHSYDICEKIFDNSPNVTISVNGGSFSYSLDDIKAIVIENGGKIYMGEGASHKISTVQTLIIKGDDEGNFEFIDNDIMRYRLNFWGQKESCYAIANTIYLPANINKIPEGIFGDYGDGCTVHFAGSQAEWNNLTIGKNGNSNYTNGMVEVKFNSVYAG